MVINDIDTASEVKSAKPDVCQLVQSAVNGLELMFDPETQLFCHRLRLQSGELVREGQSHRYTIMTLLGLHRLEETGSRTPFQVERAIETLLSQRSWIDTLGDVGLMLWLAAVAAPSKVSELYSMLGVKTALARYSGARQAGTMELAWFLSGLAHARLAHVKGLSEINNVSSATYKLLTRNQGVSGVFGHQATWRSLSGMWRGRIGSFADQVYPIYALSKVATAFNMDAALNAARRCADAICTVQGPFGQWWWHYESSSGRVFQRYPVYSVHQHGMAPMALFALGEAMQIEFTVPIYRGLSWVYGNNELAIDVRDEHSQLVWRNIHREEKYLHLREVREFLQQKNNGDPVDNLQVLFECRPYELGWLIYAFAGR